MDLNALASSFIMLMQIKIGYKSIYSVETFILLFIIVHKFIIYIPNATEKIQNLCNLKKCESLLEALFQTSEQYLINECFNIVHAS